MIKLRTLIASTALALVATSVAVAPPASAAPDCDVTQTPSIVLNTIPSAFVSGVGTATPRLNVSADVNITCGLIEDGAAFTRNNTTDTSEAFILSKYADNGATASLTGSYVIPSATQYGQWILGDVRVYYKRRASGLATSFVTLPANVLFYARSTPSVGQPYPATQSVNEGDSVALSSYLSTVYDRQESVDLQIKNGDTWDTVATESVDLLSDAFTFVYTPTKSVTYRFFYEQTDWAEAKAGQPAVINFVPKEVAKKVPSAPPAVVSDVTETTISLDWSPPADPNGTISAYRFGWDTPFGKPVPSWENTYPTSGTVPDPFVFTNLVPGADYTVWVEAVNENGRSARTSITVTTDENPIIKPPPPPPPPKRASVYVASVNRASKLYVDVNPNVGRRYWTFVTQKFVRGHWVNVKAYRTQGARETRTINLNRGLWRVVVQPKFGYRGTVSSAVFLRK